MNDVLRTERKFLLNTAEEASVRARLDATLHKDPHAGITGYCVRSLYFDTISDQDFFEKAAGIEIRKKIRLRIYDPNDKAAFLEMKQKQGTVQHKRSMKLAREDALKLIEGNYTPLLGYKDNFAAECYGLMQTQFYRPKAIVQYLRIPYIVKENNTRITLDSKIEATESSFELFSPGLNMNPVLDPSATVLEVKYNGFLLSYVQEVLNIVDKSERSVSKYVLARQNSY